MKWLWAVLLLLLLSPTSVQSQTASPILGFCVNGAKPAITSGLSSSNFNQNLIPKCTVEVVLSGTTTPAVIYADGNETPLTNPFTANTDASWTFYVPESSQAYDVVLSGGVAPNTYSLPRTLTGLAPFGGGGGGSGNPAAPVGSVQFNNGGSFGGDATFNFSAVSHVLQVMNLAMQLPKADPRNATLSAAAGCANPADPTDVLDSTCAIQAAVTYVASHPVESQSTPCVYLAGGVYKVTSTIRWPTNGNTPICIIGDSRQATVIDANGLGANNLFTFHNTGEAQGAIKLFGGGLIADFQVTGADLLNTGSMIEFNNTDDVDIMRVACTNWAGRCFNLYGDSERNVFYHVTCNSSNICFDTGFQANENRILDPIILFPGQTDGTNLCYHTGINCPASTHQYPAANTGVCSNYPAWSAGAPMAKGSVICDANNNIEVAITNGTTGSSAPSWVTTAYQFTCDGQSGDCGATPIPYGKTDWTGPIQWENVAQSTLIVPDPTPAAFLSGNKNVWDGGSDKSLITTSAILSIGVTNVVENIYCEGAPFSGQPRNAYCIWAGDLDTGVSSTFTTSALTPTATTIPVITSMYMYGDHLGTDADAAVGNSTAGVLIACPDYDPTSSLNCTSTGFTAFLKNQSEKVNMNAFSNQNNGLVHANGRCSSGSSPALCTVGSGVGSAWPTGAIVMLAQASANSTNAANIHSTAVNSRGNSGYFSLSSETLHTALADGRWLSLAQGDFGIGARPDGRAFTSIDSTGPGFAGGSASGAGLLLENFTPTTGYDAYNSQAGVVIPINGNLIVRDNDPGSSAINLPTGITVGSLDQYSRPGIQIAVHGDSFTHGVAVRQSLGQVWIFGPNGSQEYIRQIRNGSSLGMISGYQYANQYCLTDIPSTNTTGTQPLMRTCNEGGPANTANARWHFDLFQNNAWVPIDTIDAQGVHQSGVGIPGIGLSSNYVQNSVNVAGSGWSVSADPPTITFTCGQTDPYGGTGACLVNVGVPPGNFAYQNTSSSPFPAGNVMTACVWLKGAVGGEEVFFDSDINGNVVPAFEAGGASGLTTSWSRYSGSGVQFSTTRPFRWGAGGGLGVAQSFYIYNPQTQAGSTCGPDLLTTASVFNTQSVLASNNGIFNSLTDPTTSTGTSGQIPTASGSGSWQWAAPATSISTTPTVGNAACIKSAGPPVVIGTCSTAPTVSGACTCN